MDVQGQAFGSGTYMNFRKVDFSAITSNPIKQIFIAANSQSAIYIDTADKVFGAGSNQKDQLNIGVAISGITFTEMTGFSVNIPIQVCAKQG